jgi:Putative type VII ESX secretion system translocon, EccE
MRTYSGWQHENVSFLLGLSGRRVALCAVGVLLALQPILTGQITNAALMWPAAVLAVALAFVRIAGRTADEWALTAASYAWEHYRGRTRYLADKPPDLNSAQKPELELPGVLAPLRLLEADGVAILHHPWDRSFTAVARLAYPGLGLIEDAEADARVEAWTKVFGSLCTGDHAPIRLQLVVRTLPDPAATLRAWHEEHVDPAAPMVSILANETVLATAAPAACRRETYLAVTLSARHAQLAIKAAGGGEKGASTVLLRQVKALASPLAAADIRCADWLDRAGLVGVLRCGFDPHALAALERHRTGLPAHLAGPAGAQANWSTYRHDGMISATYAVHAWPLRPVTHTVLASLLADTTYRRSLAIHYAPLGPREARRAVSIERTRRETAIRLRARTGQAPSAAERHELARADGQDHENAQGAGLVRFTAYLTVTVEDVEQLEEACAEAETAALHAGLELRRLHGAQDTGFALTLPAGITQLGRRTI